MDYKNYSLRFFLRHEKIFPEHQEIKKLAKGKTRLESENNYRKRYIRNGIGGIFIPGSSIKGAIRNAVLWKMLQPTPQWFDSLKSQNHETGNLRLSKDRLKTADQQLSEEKLIVSPTNTPVKFRSYWQDTNAQLRDLFKAVKVSDANFISPPLLENINVAVVCFDGGNRVYRKKIGKKPVGLECVPIQTKAMFRLTIDLQTVKKLISGQPPSWLQSVENLLSTTHEFYGYLSACETAVFCGQSPVPRNTDDKTPVHLDRVYSCYTSNIKVVEGEFLFRTGWGGGLLSKTQFLHMDDLLREDIRNTEYRYNPSMLAPKSRCLIADGDHAIAPLGWCRLAITSAKELPSGVRPKQDGSTLFLHSPQIKTKQQKNKAMALNQVVKNTRWKKEGGTYLVAIKSQDQWAQLVGKQKPSMYQRLITVKVTGLEGGVVTQVKMA